jgi:hypothetical protein
LEVKEVKQMKNNYNTKKEFVIILVTLGLMTLLNCLWQVSELALYGEMQHRVVDDIISIPIMYSVYLNVRHWLDK